MRWVRWIAAVALAICLLPVASVVLAGAIASINGCRLHEGAVNSCIVAGRDVGETLHTMAVTGWFAMVTLPIAFTILVGWIAAEIIRMLVRRASSR
jgi:hypothetical protein